ncbi:MAG: hypothetical protein ACP5VE_02365 [Chthonomonadales bacterium]
MNANMYRKTFALLLITGCAILAMPGAAGMDQEIAPRARFTFVIPAAGVTSAAIYRPDGSLVRVLWALKHPASGRHTAAWDGKDERGEIAPPGLYRWRVLVNQGAYVNVGAIGNSGVPHNAAGHIPVNMESIAVDDEGCVYTANGWDEAGADFKKWDASGRSLYDAHYQIRNGKPNGAPYAIAVDDRYLYCSVGGWASTPWNSRQQIQRFRRSDGVEAPFTGTGLVDGHIQVWEWPEHHIPAGTGEADTNLLRHPLRSLAVSGNDLLVADALGGRVLRFEKDTGMQVGAFSVPLPLALTVRRDGTIWVAHEHRRISVYSPAGSFLKEPFTNLGDVQAVNFDASGRLLVADAGAGQVKIFDVNGPEPRLVGTLGRKAHPGDRDPAAFYHLRGVAAGPKGEIFTIQTEPLCGARLAKWSSNLRLVWEQFGEEFVSLGNYGREDPSLFISMTLHRYRLGRHSAGDWTYTGSIAPEGNRHTSDVHGVPRILHIGKGTFVFMPTGDGVQIYRYAKGILHLSSIVGGRDPAPDGSRNGPPAQWTWSDRRGIGDLQMRDVEWFRTPGRGTYAVFGMDVDHRGTIWFANLATHSIWALPMDGLDRRGNPVYHWAHAREIIARDTSSLRFDPTMVQHAADGSLYAFGWSAPWPAPANNPFWMGGTTLAHFGPDRRLRWALPLPEVCVGLDAVPGGGCMAGGGRSAHIYHYTPDGLLAGILAPGKAMGGESGWMDNHASVAVNRDPRDGVLDVFAEDDYDLRIGWYRVDDRHMRRMEGSIVLPPPSGVTP